jgi:hypothetical protein
MDKVGENARPSRRYGVMTAPVDCSRYHAVRSIMCSPADQVGVASSEIPKPLEDGPITTTVRACRSPA